VKLFKEEMESLMLKFADLELEKNLIRSENIRLRALNEKQRKTIENLSLNFIQNEA
jgi:hypothetical protein